MFNESMAKYRLESLKMAYGIIFNCSEIKKDPEQIKDGIQDVFSLSDMNLNYIINGEHPYCDHQKKEDH